MWLFIFQFFELFLPLLLTISKIESVKLKYVIIAKTWAPPSDRQREGGVLSTLLTEEPWIFGIFDFSIFDFRFWHFDFWSYKWSSRTCFCIIFMRLTHLDTWFCLISISNFRNLEISKKVTFYFSVFSIRTDTLVYNFQNRIYEIKVRYHS